MGSKPPIYCCKLTYIEIEMIFDVPFLSTRKLARGNYGSALPLHAGLHKYTNSVCSLKVITASHHGLLWTGTVRTEVVPTMYRYQRRKWWVRFFILCFESWTYFLINVCNIFFNDAVLSFHIICQILHCDVVKRDRDQMVPMETV